MMSYTLETVMNVSSGYISKKILISDCIFITEAFISMYELVQLSTWCHVDDKLELIREVSHLLNKQGTMCFTPLPSGTQNRCDTHVQLLLS